jgi:hypothetical protein
MRGRLLAYACAVGLFAAPVFAATDSSTPATDSSPAMGTSSGGDTTMHHHPAHRITHTSPIPSLHFRD